MYIEGSRMSEAQTSGTKPKKMVSRKVAFALGLVCIILIAFIAYFTIDRSNLAKQIAEQNSTISQLESNITDLQNQIAIANATIASLEASVISTVKIASVTKHEWWYSTFQEFSFTVQVANNGTDTVKGITVVIRLYHDWMNIYYPVTKYTNEVQGYLFNGNTLDFGTIPAGGNETQSINIWVDDLYVGLDAANETVGAQVPINYAVATMSLGNITLDKQTLQINQDLAEQTWVFP
jgi:cell division protein FtsL